MDGNVIVKCLGKTLKNEIKFVSIVEMKCFNAENKDIESQGASQSGAGIKKKILCLGTEKVFILHETMEKRFDTIPYELISHLELDKKSKEGFFVHIKLNSIMKNTNILKISIKSELRATLIKCFMCYYSVYYMHRFCTMKSLIILSKENQEVKKEEPGGYSKFKHRNLKNYKFYLNGNIQKEYNNVYFKIKYDPGQPTDKKQDDTFTPDCEINIEISDPILIGKFDSQKDDKDLSFYANNTFQIYMRNILKINKYWLTKNKLYFRKYNFAEDVCQWEGWIIEARTADPFYRNYIFIFLRRKFLPPYFDTYQNFMFTLCENCSYEHYKINPAANKLLETITSSLHSTVSQSMPRDSALFLKAKVDALLVDEETLLYYQYNQNIVGEDVYKFGFTMIYSLLCYYELLMKEKILPLKSSLVSKFKYYEFESLQKWTFEKKFCSFLDKINEFIDQSIVKKEPVAAVADESEVEKDKEKIIEQSLEDEFQAEKVEFKTPENEKSDEEIMAEQEKLLKIKRNWRLKVMRFISYCFNGGVTDFLLSYEKFVTDIFLKSQGTNNDIQDVLFQSINLVEFDNLEGKSSKDKLSTLSDNSKLIFNDEAMAVAIKTGFLARILSDNPSAFPKFLFIILSKYCTNKILNAVLEFLKVSAELSGDDASEERKAFIHIVPPLISMFADKRKCPQTLTLCCKCLCLLLCKKCDEVFRKKIVFEGKIVSVIATYLELYDFDEKLVLCLLDLFALVMNDPELPIIDHLYGFPDRLFDKLKKFLEPTSVPGTFYSQRIIIKILTIFLNLTNKNEAEVKPKINSSYKLFYDLLIRLVHDTRKYKVIDSQEEESYILEFKTYWLLCILTFKNPVGKECLKNLGFKTFIEEKSKKFIKVLELIINMKKAFSESKITAIGKNISKFFEFVYYYIISDRDEVVDIKKNSASFNILRLMLKEHQNTLMLQEKETSVFEWLEKLFKITDDEFS